MLATLISLVSTSHASAFSIFTNAVGSTVQETLALAPRWSSLSGLNDGIQVGVQSDFAAALNLAPGQPSLVEERVRDAFGAWENSALQFDLVVNSTDVAEGTSAGFEIDLFAVQNSHAVFAGTSFFGFAAVDSNSFSNSRPLTNGQTTPGYSITGVDIYLNIDNFAFLAPLGQAIQLDILTRVLIHEIGHGIGLGHPNSDDLFGAQPNYDTDTDPLNEMSIDPGDPFAMLTASNFRDHQAIMSNGPCGIPATAFCAASAFTSLQYDDIGGRDTLYPVIPEPSTVVLVGLGLIVLGLRSQATLGLIVLASFMGVADLAEAQVTIAFAAGTSSANESNAETLVQVTLSTGGATLVAPVSVDVALGSGSATIPDDYMLSSSSLFFPAGSGDGTAYILSVTTIDDSLVEGDETVILALDAGSLTGPATLGAQQSHSVTITDNDSATVSFALAASSVAEAGQSHEVEVTLHLTGTAAGAPTLATAVSVGVWNGVGCGRCFIADTATAGADYSFANPTVSFAAASTDGDSQAVTLTVSDDSSVEDDETLTLRLDNLQFPPSAAAAQFGSIRMHEVTIVDDDPESPPETVALGPFALGLLGSLLLLLGGLRLAHRP